MCPLYPANVNDPTKEMLIGVERVCAAASWAVMEWVFVPQRLRGGMSADGL